MNTPDPTVTRFGFIEPSYLLAVGSVLLGTFVALGSDLGLQASVIVMACVWALHLSVGLAAIRVGVIRLSRWPVASRWPDLILLGLAGLMASFVLAPLSFLIDQVLFARGIATDDARVFGVTQWAFPALIEVTEEWAHVVGPTVFVAVLLGLPAWWSRRQVAPALLATPESRSESRSEGSCLQRLPPALGLDIVAARAELQYVRIYTARGDALVLGALKDVAAQREADGQLVHRAWWVSDQHVRTLRRRGDRYLLTLSNGLEVPVSRRRQGTLIKQFGISTTLT